MSDVDQLLSEYKQAHRDSGDADPRPYPRAPPPAPDRELLAGLIDAYLGGRAQAARARCVGSALLSGRAGGRGVRGR